jgi:hypothetical protein
MFTERMNAIRRTIEDFLKERDAKEEDIRQRASASRLGAVRIGDEVIDFDQEGGPREVTMAWRVVQDVVQRPKQPLGTTRKGKSNSKCSIREGRG